MPTEPKAVKSATPEALAVWVTWLPLNVSVTVPAFATTVPTASFTVTFGRLAVVNTPPDVRLVVGCVENVSERATW